MIVVRCWGCSIALTAFDAKYHRPKHHHHHHHRLLAALFVRSLRGDYATAQEEEFRNRRRKSGCRTGDWVSNTTTATTNVKSFASTFPRCLARTMGGLIPTVLSLVYFLVSNVSNVHSKADDRKGDDFERRNGDGGVDMLTCFVLRIALLLRVNIYWNYPILS